MVYLNVELVTDKYSMEPQLMVQGKSMGRVSIGFSILHYIPKSFLEPRVEVP